MKWEDIQRTHPDEWVLLEVEEVDEEFNPIEAEVLAHSRDKGEIYQEVMRIRPTKFSIDYTGIAPQELAVVLHTLR